MIYFIRAGDTGAVKIGWTKDAGTLNARIATLQTGSPDRLKVIRVVAAERWAEVWFHGFFAGVRLAGEWFAYHDDMLSLEPPSQPPPKPILGFRKPDRGITAEQCRAARAILGLTVSQVAEGAGVATRSVLRSEDGAGPEVAGMRVRTLERIQRYYESRGIEFVLGGPGYRPTVRMRDQ